MSLLLTNMIRCFRVKSKEERSKIVHLVRGRKIGDEVAENKGQEAREYTMRGHLHVAELIRVCRKGIPLNSGVRDGSAPTFLDPVWDDVPTDENKRRAMSDSESDSKEEEGDLLALEGTGGDADMDE
ncbi:hypothetical protein H5410_004419 [Solanum commersonii]|uniref:Uncharacterized protein n=1 Tax=Solanum commersonii TaxID=4109 RepID=A0A9J6B7M9_SOLCO|nr:hypothetical protein H5410_004419 [Solanum commersonii]